MGGGPLWLCLYFPDLALEVRLRSAPSQAPSVLAVPAGRQQQVWLCNAAAAAAGITRGMPLGAAQALAEVQVLSRAPQLEQEALERLACWGLQFSAWVSLETSEALLLEVGASLRLFGGLEALMTRIQTGLDSLGYQARMTAAPTAQAALCLCRAGRQERIETRAELNRALRDLSLEALVLPGEQIDALAGMGIHSLGDCRRLPRDGLARRIDPRLVLLMDRAWGRLPDPRPRFEPPPRFDRNIELNEETDNREVLLFVAQRLLAELSGYLRARYASVQRLDWFLQHERGRATRFRIGLRVPGRDPGQLLILFKERLQRLELCAPVRGVRLEAADLLIMADTNLDLTGSGDEAPAMDIERLCERLAARLGGDAVHGLCMVAEHRPECAWQPCSPDARHERIAVGGRRPLWLLLEPRQLSLIAGRPACDGPLHVQPDSRERIETGWWDGGDCRRDYHLACNPYGEWFWIFRDLQREAWYLHGIFE
jgi:protein ImuB